MWQNQGLKISVKRPTEILKPPRAVSHQRILRRFIVQDILDTLYSVTRYVKRIQVSCRCQLRPGSRWHVLGCHTKNILSKNWTLKIKRYFCYANKFNYINLLFLNQIKFLFLKTSLTRISGLHEGKGWLRGQHSLTGK